MADHQQIIDLAKKGALAQRKEHFDELLADIHSACATVQRASVMMLPGNLEDIKEQEIVLAARKLERLLPEARALKAELERAGIYVW